MNYFLKKINICFILFFSIITNFIVIYANDDSLDLGLLSKSYILMEEDTGKILLEKNSHEQLPPASVTKIMTLLLIFEAIEDGKIKLEDNVIVSEYAASMGGSQVFLEPNETQTVKDMIKCIAIASANDASVAMAEYVGGSEENFVKMMNDKAKELGMNETNFLNACGLDKEGHLTSAFDIAIMSRELVKNYPEIKEYSTIWQDTIIHKTRNGESEFGLSNTNKLIKWYDKATGLKTGSTNKALYCLSGTAENDELKLIAVVMAAPDNNIRFSEVIKLFDYGFTNYNIESIGKKGDIVSEIPIYKGNRNTVTGIIDKDINIIAKKGNNINVKTEVEIPPGLTAPINQGEKIGEIIYKIDDKEETRCNIIADYSVDKINVFQMILKLFSLWC